MDCQLISGHGSAIQHPQLVHAVHDVLLWGEEHANRDVISIAASTREQGCMLVMMFCCDSNTHRRVSWGGSLPSNSSRLSTLCAQCKVAKSTNSTEACNFYLGRRVHEAKLQQSTLSAKHRFARR